MKQQTPLRKAIADLQVIKERLAPNPDGDIVHIATIVGKLNGIEHALSVLITLLPEERRVIEEAYDKGCDDMGNSEFGLDPEHLGASDFFISNFEQ